MASDARIGTLIAGYRIESLIGRGGMSVVYLARHEGLERKAALKLLAPELAENDAFRQRFIRESRIAAGLDHPNVIPVYDAGEADGELYIAMRYVRGSDLRSLLSEHGPIEVGDVVRVVDQLGAALDAAHEEGLVHRDVKLANVLLSPATPPARVGHLYLADFGLTKKSLSGSGVTKSGQFVGTIDYVAPEQIRSEGVDGRTDIYSLGCLLYECLTGEPPFVRDTEVAVMFAHLNDPPPTADRPELPRAVDDVVARAMAKAPSRRYPSAGAMASAARASLQPTLAADRSTASAAVRRAQGLPAPRGPRRRMLIGGGVVAALVAVAVVVAVVAGGGGAPQPGGSPSGGGSSTASPTASVAPTGAGLPDGFAGVAQLAPRTGEIKEGFPLSLAPMPAPVGATAGRPVLAGEGALWLSAGGYSDVQVAKVDPDSGEELDRLTLRTRGAQTVFFAEGHSSLWVLTFAGLFGGDGEDELFRIDPGSDKVVADIPIGLRGVGVAIGDEGIWVLASGGTLREIDPGRNVVSQTIPGLPGANGIALGGGAVWVLDTVAAAVYRVDPTTRRWDTIELPGGGDGIAGDASGIWVMDRATGQVVRIDPDTGDLGQQIRVGVRPASISTGAGYVWLPTPSEGTVWRIDVASGEPTSFQVGGDPGPGFVSVGEGGVWTTVG